jgi:hypothetical protein
MSVKIVISPFLRMQKDVVYHSLYKTPVRVDASKCILAIGEFEHATG